MRAGSRLREVSFDPHRIGPRAPDARAREFAFQNHRLIAVRPPAVEHKIAQRIGNHGLPSRSSLPQLHGLKNVRVVPEDEVGAGGRGLVGELSLLRRRLRCELPPPMQRDDDDVRSPARAAYLLLQAALSEESNSRRPRQAHDPLRRELAVGEKGDAQAVLVQDRWQVSVPAGHAGSAEGDAQLAELIHRLDQASFAAVHGVIICQRDDIEPAVRQH